MATLNDITVESHQNPASVKVGPWVTMNVFDKNNNEIAHMDASCDGTQRHTIATDEHYYPLTIKFTQNEAPEAEKMTLNYVPEDAVELN